MKYPDRVGISFRIPLGIIACKLRMLLADKIQHVAHCKEAFKACRLYHHSLHLNLYHCYPQINVSSVCHCNTQRSAAVTHLLTTTPSVALATRHAVGSTIYWTQCLKYATFRVNNLYNSCFRWILYPQWRIPIILGKLLEGDTHKLCTRKLIAEEK